MAGPVVVALDEGRAGFTDDNVPANGVNAVQIPVQGHGLPEVGNLKTVEAHAGAGMAADLTPASGQVHGVAVQEVNTENSRPRPAASPAAKRMDGCTRVNLLVFLRRVYIYSLNNSRWD